ncbi:MAG: hypothetical protein OES47_10835 [Acidobacteriota bacterium]|nr:hypothetical protein [Acidobacteriota bacterium]
MKALGEYLVQNGWVTKLQLDQALAKQELIGGRLGTCLLETGVLDERLLLKALSLQSGAPSATAGDLADIPPSAIARLPARIAASHLAIPFRVFSNKVDVAVADLSDLSRLDELAFVLGKRVNLHVASEAAVRRALERYYEIPCPNRFRHVPEAGPQQSQPSADTAGMVEQAPEAAESEPTAAPEPAAASEPAAAPEPAAAQPTTVAGETTPPPTPPRRPEKKESIRLTADEESALWGEMNLQLSVAEELDDPRDGEAANFGARLAAAETPEDVGTALLAALSEHFLRIVLFRILRHRVSGWMHWGPQIDKDWLAEYSVGIERPTVFREILTSRRLFFGKLDDGVPHTDLARCWGGDTKSECMVIPVLVRERMASAIYCDRGALGVQGVDVSAVGDLCARAGLAFERLILERKLRS